MAAAVRCPSRWTLRRAAFLLAAALCRCALARAEPLDRRWRGEEWPSKVFLKAFEVQSEAFALVGNADQLTSSSRALVEALACSGVDAEHVIQDGRGRASGARPPVLAYPSVLGIMSIVVVFTYRGRGWRVVTSILSYMVAGGAVKVLIKSVLAQRSFDFPCFVTTIAMLVSALSALLVVMLRDRGRAQGFWIPSGEQQLRMIFPIAATTALSICFGNLALGRTTVAFTEIISSASPISCIILLIVFRMPFHKMLIWPTLAVVMGCALSIVGVPQVSPLGFLFCLLSMLSSALKGVLLQRWVDTYDQRHFDPVVLQMWSSLPSCALVLALSLATEGLGPLQNMLARSSSELFSLCLDVGLLSLSALVMNTVQVSLTKDLGTVGTQLLSCSKSVLTLLAGTAVFGDPVSLLEAAGFVEVLIGGYVYQSMDQEHRRQSLLQSLIDAQKAVESTSPRGGGGASSVATIASKAAIEEESSGSDDELFGPDQVPSDGTSTASDQNNAGSETVSDDCDLLGSTREPRGLREESRMDG